MAHHGNAAYDMDKSVALKGTVTLWVWANPHCMLQLDVPDDHGQVVQWSAETENPSSMVHYGWTKQSIKPGDQVMVTVMPAKNAKPIGRIVEVVLPNGQRLTGTQPPGRRQTRGLTQTVRSRAGRSRPIESLMPVPPN